MADDKFFDKSALEVLREVDEGLVKEMIDIFFENVPKRINEMKSGIESGILDITRRAAHTLKSSAGQIGLLHVQEISKTIEKLALEKDSENIPAFLNSLEEALEQVKPLLEQERTQTS